MKLTMNDLKEMIEQEKSDRISENKYLKDVLQDDIKGLKKHYNKWSEHIQNIIHTHQKLYRDTQNTAHEQAKRIDDLERIIRAGLGPCPQCTGSGMTIYPDPVLERDNVEPCETCKGSGKIPLDLADMIEQLKCKGRNEPELVKEDLPF